MTMKPSHALLAILAVIAAPAFAQTPPATPTEAPATEAPAEAPPTEAPATEAPATEAPAAEAPATEAPAAEAAPADGQPAPADAANAAPAEQQPGQAYVKSTHGDWLIRCIRTGQDAEPCEMYQLLKDASGNPLGEATVVPLVNAEVAAGVTFLAPLETDLMQGLGFAVDNGKPRAYPFSFCAQIGCFSRVGFNSDEVAQMKRGNSATLTMLRMGDDPKNLVSLPVSLSGFTAAFDEMSKIAADARAQMDTQGEAPKPAQ
ncbi:invasion associated locus B family protein [Paracoccus sp. (in: a-proteobacteria)]|uniref:invasion associated locus B family protein n=1 Tax=Paracoccus sp. TaxID=267 RepID=UPI003A83D806